MEWASQSRLAEDLLGFIADAKIVGLNTEFDRMFLKAELAAAGYEPLTRDRFLDLAPFLPDAIRRSGMDAIVEWAGGVGKNPLSTEVVASIFWRIKNGAEA